MGYGQFGTIFQYRFQEFRVSIPTARRIRDQLIGTGYDKA